MRGRYHSDRPEPCCRQSAAGSAQKDTTAYRLYLATKGVQHGADLEPCHAFDVRGNHKTHRLPNSQEVLREHTTHLSEREKNRILHDNVAELLGLA